MGLRVSPILLLTLVANLGFWLNSHFVVSRTVRRSLYTFTSGGIYLDKLFSNETAARVELVGNFTKRSSRAIIYICYERKAIISATLSSLLESEDLSSFDLIISQDGGSNFTIQHDKLGTVHHLYIRHPHNLCVGRHHYFVKRFAFEIMGYDTILIVEEDNKLHPQVLQMLDGMLQLSRNDRRIGLVSITDLDNSRLIDMHKYGNAVLATEINWGHLWVYGLFADRYYAIKKHLDDYYRLIKGHNYRLKSEPPLSNAIVRLHAAKGFPPGIELSQDMFHLHSLSKEGYTQRLQSMVRLFEPLGWSGTHFITGANSFYTTYGKGMYNGTVKVDELYVLNKDPTKMAEAQRDLSAALNQVYQEYLGRPVDQTAMDENALRMFTGKLNSVELVHNMLESEEYRLRFAQLQKMAQAGGAPATTGTARRLSLEAAGKLDCTSCSTENYRMGRG